MVNRIADLNLAVRNALRGNSIVPAHGVVAAGVSVFLRMERSWQGANPHVMNFRGQSDRLRMF